MNENLEIYQTIVAQFKGRCVVNSAHTFKRNQVIGRVRNADNPLSLYSGYACKKCTEAIPHVKPA